MKGKLLTTDGLKKQSIVIQIIVACVCQIGTINHLFYIVGWVETMRLPMVSAGEFWVISRRVSDFLCVGLVFLLKRISWRSGVRSLLV